VCKGNGGGGDASTGKQLILIMNIASKGHSRQKMELVFLHQNEEWLNRDTFLTIGGLLMKKLINSIIKVIAFI
jgi:hypothetical protein